MQPGLRTGEGREQRNEGLTPSPDLLQMQGASRGAGVPQAPTVGVVWGGAGGPQRWMLRGSRMMMIIGLKGTGDHCGRYFGGLLLWEALSTPMSLSAVDLPFLFFFYLPSFLPFPRHNPPHPPFGEFPGVCTPPGLSESAHWSLKPLSTFGPPWDSEQL